MVSFLYLPPHIDYSLQQQLHVQESLLRIFLAWYKTVVSLQKYAFQILKHVL